MAVLTDNAFYKSYTSSNLKRLEKTLLYLQTYFLIYVLTILLEKEKYFQSFLSNTNKHGSYFINTIYDSSNMLM